MFKDQVVVLHLTQVDKMSAVKARYPLCAVQTFQLGEGDLKPLYSVDALSQYCKKIVCAEEHFFVYTPFSIYLIRGDR